MTEKEPPLRLTALEIQNILRITAVRLTMGEGALIIEGANEAGKSSALKSVEIGLAGMSCTPDEPIHADRKKGKIVLSFGGPTEEDPDLVPEQFTVTKQFTRGKRPTLTIKSGSKKYNSPQTLLESLLNFVALKPLEFLTYDAAKQLKVLSKLMGLDTKALDEEEKTIYDERKDANREVKRLKAVYESIPHREGAPDEETSVKELMAELEAIQEHNQKGEQMKAILAEASKDCNAALARKEELERELEEITRKIGGLSERQSIANANYGRFTLRDDTKLRDKIAKADETNAAVRDNIRKMEACKAYQTAETEAEGFNDLLEDIQRQKAEMRLQAAERLPVPELTLTENGVSYKGKPLAQAGASAQLRVSVGVAMALNQDKRIKLLLLDNAEQLDPANTKLVLELAAEKGFQVIVARVGDGKEASVIIEDGTVKEENDG